MYVVLDLSPLQLLMIFLMFCAFNVLIIGHEK